MARLAIKGHADRGDEVIKILELLGGKNTNHNSGKCITLIYFINNKGYIETGDPRKMLDFTVLTLEEVEALIPYKIGDKVLFEDKICEITGMRWHKHLEKIVYDAKGEKCTLSLFEPDKLKPVVNNEEFQNKLLKIYPDGKTGHIQLIPHKDYEIKEINGDFVMIKKLPKYPTAFVECCEVLMGKTDFQDFGLVLTKISTTLYEENRISPEPPHISLINNFYKLLICRDAYWEIVGEQMGLGKSWKPKHEYDEEIFFIYCDRVNGINKGQGFPTDNFCLVFPTAEMRNAFYENFKDLIEECKELL